MIGSLLKAVHRRLYPGTLVGSSSIANPQPKRRHFIASTGKRILMQQKTELPSLEI